MEEFNKVSRVLAGRDGSSTREMSQTCMGSSVLEFGGWLYGATRN